MIKAYREWRTTAHPRPSAYSRDPLIVGMSANASVTDQDEAFRNGMHIYVSKPVESIYLKIIVDAVKASILGDAATSPASSPSSPTPLKWFLRGSKRQNALAKCLYDVNVHLRSEGVNAVSHQGKRCVRISDLPLPLA